MYFQLHNSQAILHKSRDTMTLMKLRLGYEICSVFFGMAYLPSISFSFLLGIEGFISNFQFAPLVNHALNIKFWFDYSHEFLEDILIL